MSQPQQQSSQTVLTALPNAQGSSHETHVSKTSNNRPKIALLVHENQYGGGTRQSFYILNALCNRGLPAMVVSNTKEASLGTRIESSRLPVETYYSGTIQRALNPWRDLKAMAFLIRTCLKAKPDIVLCSGVKLMGMGTLAAWLTGVPNRWSMVRGQGAAPGSRSMPFVLALEKIVSWLGGRFITVSEYDRQWMLTHQVTQSDRVITILNGTTIPEEPSSSEKHGTLWDTYNLPKGAFTIGMVGRFTQQKRYDVFIQVMAELCRQYAHVYGFLIGDGDEREILQALVDATGYSDRIHITGYQADMPSVYQGLHASVLFSLYEGCPNALLESSAWGVPALTDRVCGNPEVIQDGINGAVIESGDVEAAVKALSPWITNPDKAHQLGLAGHQLAKTKFDQTVQVNRVIDTLLEGSGSITNSAQQEGSPC